MKTIWSHIKSKLTYYIIAVLALLLILSVATMSGLRQSNDSLQRAVTYQREVATVWQDKYGKSHARNEALVVDKKTLETMYGEELKKNFGIKAKNTTSVTTLSTSNTGTSAIKITPNKDFKYNKDNWLSYSGSIVDDTLFLSHEYTDSLTFITGYKRRLFKPDTYFVEVISHNPNTTFKSLNRVEVKERVKRFGVGPGVYYTPSGPTIGVGLQYNVIRF